MRTCDCDIRGDCVCQPWEGEETKKLQVQHLPSDYSSNYSLTRNGISAEDVMAEQADAEARWGEERVTND